MTTWAVQYIGEEWTREHDCWAFARRVQREVFGRDVPVVDVDALDRRACMAAIAGHPLRQRWQQVEVPVDGDLVLLARAHHPSHVGVWTAADGGGVVHCLQRAGVLFQSLQVLRLSRWTHIEYWTCMH